MRDNWRVIVAVVAIAIVGSIFALLVFGTSPSSQRMVTSETTTTVTTSTTVTTGETTTPENTTGVGQEGPVPEAPPKKLLATVKNFAEAYYLLRPADTVQSLIKRLSPFVEKVGSLRPSGKFGSTPADRYRIDQQLTIRGYPMMDQIVVGQVNNNTRLYQVVLSVRIVTFRVDGVATDETQETTNSTWLYKNGHWYIQSLQRG